MPTTEWMYPHRMWLQNGALEFLWCLCSQRESATHSREKAWVPWKCFDESPKLSFRRTVLWDQQPSSERLCGTYAEPKQSIPDPCANHEMLQIHSDSLSFLPNPYRLLASQRIYAWEYVYDSIVSKGMISATWGLVQSLTNINVYKMESPPHK